MVKYTRKDTLDRFYTKPDVAENLLENLCLHQYDEIIEPSAGSGSFVYALRRKGFNPTAYDIDLSTQWKHADWLKVQPTELKNILVVGNPPFGKNGSLALKFINRSALFAKTIAFILPNSFRKTSMINRLHPNIFVSRIIDCPEDIFTLNGNTYDVPCSFFIYDVDRNKTRIPVEKLQCKLFDFVDDKESADFSIRRVGVNAGKIGGLYVSSSSNYFIKSRITNIIPIFERCDFQKFARWAAGPPSLSKQEIISEFTRVLDDWPNC